MVNPLRAVSAAPTPKTVHFIAFVQQRFRKVGTVSARYTTR
jgi:hypothetical protein